MTTEQFKSIDKVTLPYLIRSYDHDYKTSPTTSQRPQRSSTMPTGRTNTNLSGAGFPGNETLGSRRINYGKAQAFQIWEVARAATAAPYYFEPLKIESPGSVEHLLFQDGGFSLNNNPTLEGKLEIEEYYDRNSINIVVSVGTARSSPKSGRGFTRVAKGFVNKFTDPELRHNDMRQTSQREGFTYYRLNDPGTLEVELDEWKPRDNIFTRASGSRTLSDIRTAFNRWAADPNVIQDVQNCAADLVNCRRARAKDRVRWERYATGSQFACPQQKCEVEEFVARDAFRTHLHENHNWTLAEIETRTEECRRQWQYQKAVSR